MHTKSYFVRKTQPFCWKILNCVVIMNKCFQGDSCIFENSTEYWPEDMTCSNALVHLDEYELIVSDPDSTADLEVKINWDDSIAR